jgi:hypothetical protein
MEARNMGNVPSCYAGRARINREIREVRLRSLYLLPILALSVVLAGAREHLDEALMRATVKIEGRKRDGISSLGTGFFVGQNVTTRKGDTLGVVLLVTAEHVLDSIREDSAWIYMRQRLPDGNYAKQLERIEIRRKGTPAWTRHTDDSVDVAVLRPSLYDYRTTLPACVLSHDLATDDDLRLWSLGPGDEVRCLGYPLGAEGEQAGFPILRGGLIASYPILPSLKHPRIQYDFEIYEGNSGGPVYLVESTRPDSANRIYKGDPVQMVLGLVTEQYWSAPGITPKTEIKLGCYVPAAFIQETIDRYLRENGFKAIPW